MSDVPPPAQSDDKDWTWVLDRACDECGARVGDLSIAEVSEANRSNADAWALLMGRDEAWVRARPQPDVWSPLEYACHVRDVFRLFLERLDLMLTQDAPGFANWDPNVTAEEERYDLADPQTVGADLLEAAEALAARFDGIQPEQLGRTGLRSDGAAFTVETFARYELHDPEHHLWDVSGVRSTVGAA